MKEATYVQGLALCGLPGRKFPEAFRCLKRQKDKGTKTKGDFVMNGKTKCKLLKEIRRRIAEENEIAYITSECRHKGDCLGTCPKCESELRYLEKELEKKRKAGQSVALAGLAIAATFTFTSCDTANLTDPSSWFPIPPGETTVLYDGDIRILPSAGDLLSRAPEERNAYVSVFHRSDFTCVWQDALMESEAGKDVFSVLHEGSRYRITIAYGENGQAEAVEIEEEPLSLTGLMGDIYVPDEDGTS